MKRQILYIWSRNIKKLGLDWKAEISHQIVCCQEELTLNVCKYTKFEVDISNGI